MNTRALLNLGLLLLVIVLGLLAYLQPGIEPQPELPRLTELSGADLNRIRIEDRDGETVVLAREGTRWRLQEPVRVPANAFRVETLLRLATETSHTRLDARGLELSEFGLDIPRLRVFLNEREFVFGTTDPLEGRRYVRVGDTVHLVTDRYSHLLSAGFTEFVSLQLLPEERSIVEITAPDWRLARSAEGAWRLTPERPGLSADRINTLVDAWRSAQAIWIQPYEPAEAQGEIGVRLEGLEEPLRFAVLSRAPELVLARPDLGVQYHLPEEGARALLDLTEEAKAPDQEDSGGTVLQDPDQ